MRVTLGQSREEVKVACHEGSACVNSTADLGAVRHVQIWTKLQHNVGQVALDCDWHHPLEGVSSGKTRNVNHEYDAISTTALTSRWCNVDDVLGLVMDKTMLVPPPTLY
jgi:hypothetical protein